MHYVMSDIHGHYQKYKEMLKKINFSDNDKLYIIGDIIDKGEDSGNLLLDIITDSRVVPMMGNHELMMIEAVKNERNLWDWFYNGAERTIEQMESAGYKYEDVIEEVKKFPLIINDINVNNNNFYLCHACPVINAENRRYYLDEIREMGSEYLVLWHRKYAYEGYANENLYMYHPNTFFLIGHTPTIHCTYSREDEKGEPMISIYPDENKKIINIDCGCAAKLRLGCLRLEDFAEFYT